MLRKSRSVFFIIEILLGFLIFPCQARNLLATENDHPDLKTLVSQMEERARERDSKLLAYSVERSYRVENLRFHKEGEAAAKMIYVAPSEKVFEVQSTSGTSFIRKGVINRMIDAEIKNASPELKPKSAITSDNYEFSWVGTEKIADRLQYVLHAKPKRKDQYLFDAKIWVDAEDYAVTRIQGRPAKNPSFWTRKVEFTHEYKKFGPFWLPVKNHAVSQVFLFGQTTTDLEYFDYQINQPGLKEQAAKIRGQGQNLEIQIDPKDKK